MPWAEARPLLEATNAPLIAGLFDPLTSAHAKRLAELAATHGTLFVLVTSAEDCILPAGARAELVASVACVRCVLTDEAILDEIPLARLIREESADARRRDELTRHVHARHANA